MTKPPVYALQTILLHGIQVVVQIARKLEKILSKLQCAIIGCGSWASRAHLPALQRIPGVELVAVCDSDAHRAEQFALSASVPAVYSRVEALFVNERLDFVCVVTPDDAHSEAVTSAAEAGVHVVCEKPLATTLAEARRLEEIASSREIHTRMGFILRFAPAVQQMQQLLREGAIGDPHLMMVFQQNGQFLDPAKPAHWKMDGARTGGGAIVEYGIHSLDLMIWLMGDIARITGSSQTQIPQRSDERGGTTTIEVDDSTVWIAECSSGARVIGHAGWATPGRPPGLEIRIFGSKGALKAELSDEHPDDQRLTMAAPDGFFRPVPLPATTLAPSPWWETWTELLLKDFVENLGGARPAGVPTFADGVNAQKVLDGLLSSMDSHSWVTL
jgi:predicted dehydrogenase